MPKISVPEHLKSLKKDVKEIDQTKRVDEQISKPGKYEITENDTFKIVFYLYNKEGRWLVVDKSASGTPDVEEHWVEFKMWTFEEDIEMRKQASSYDPVKRLHLVDNDFLDRLKIQRLLKAWSFEKDNPRLKLLHVNGILVDESYKAFMKLYPNIVRYIIGRMNNVLEYNQ